MLLLGVTKVGQVHPAALKLENLIRLSLGLTKRLQGHDSAGKTHLLARPVRVTKASQAHRSASMTASG